MNLKFKRTPLAAGVLLALSSPVYSPQVIAAQGDKVETEFRANITTLCDQIYPSIAMDADGDFVIAWTSYGQDTSDSNGVYARRYIADDKPFTQDISPAGIEFPVNTFTTGNQDNSAKQ